MKFAFDVTLNSVVRVEAAGLEEARTKVALLDAVNIADHTEVESPDLYITEVSVMSNPQRLRPFEIDGREV